MILFIDGSDINHITLGRVSLTNSHWSLVSSDVAEARPENFLAAIHNFVGTEVIASIIAVTGPGSATSLRTSLAIVNSLALAKLIPIYGVQYGASGGELPFATDTLLPTYHHDPVITVSTRDALLRSL